MTLPHILAGLLAVSVRLSGLMLFAPFFGSAAVPARVKSGLVLLLTLLLYPMLATKLDTIELSQWPFLAFRELLIGAGMGISTQLVFDGVQLAGQVLSVQIGFSLVNILDPQTQAESTVVAMFNQTLAMLLFLRLGIPLYLLRAIAKSFDYLPPQACHLSGAFMQEIVHIGGSVTAVGLQIAAPVLSATLVVDVALGLLGKASGQLPLMLIGPSVKTLLGLAVLTATLNYWPDLFAHLFLHSLGQTEHLLQLAR